MLQFQISNCFGSKAISIFLAALLWNPKPDFFQLWLFHHELKDNEHQISCANVNKKRVGPGSLWDIGPARYPKDGFFIVLCSLECARNDNSHPEFITLINSVMNSGWELSFRWAQNWARNDEKSDVEIPKGHPPPTTI